VTYQQTAFALREIRDCISSQNFNQKLLTATVNGYVIKPYHVSSLSLSHAGSNKRKNSLWARQEEDTHVARLCLPHFFNIFIFNCWWRGGDRKTSKQTHRNTQQFISRVTRAQLSAALIHRPPWNAALRLGPSPGQRVEALRPTGLPRPLGLLLLWKARHHYQFRFFPCWGQCCYCCWWLTTTNWLR